MDAKKGDRAILHFENGYGVLSTLINQNPNEEIFLFRQQQIYEWDGEKWVYVRGYNDR